jgi:hypothetical protein
LTIAFSNAFVQADIEASVYSVFFPVFVLLNPAHV